MNRSIVLLVMLLLGAMGNAGMAGTIVYSWEGRIVPDDVDEDPWDIGGPGRRYVITVTVDEDQFDDSPAIDSAAFELSGAELLIDGLPPPRIFFTNPGSIGFNDDPLFDSPLIFLERVSLNGTAERFVTSVRLPASTYAFTKTLERPPLFSPAAITTAGGGGGLSSYNTFFDVGTIVTATLIPTGDLTKNGFVDFEDLTILLANWNQHVTSANGNLVQSGTTPVNFEDLTFLLAAWTGPGPAAAPEAALNARPIPEPSTLLLGLLALLGVGACCTRGRRRSRV